MSAQPTAAATSSRPRTPVAGRTGLTRDELEHLDQLLDGARRAYEDGLLWTAHGCLTEAAEICRRVRTGEA
jgi:hypothetical protein